MRWRKVRSSDGCCSLFACCSPAAPAERRGKNGKCAPPPQRRRHAARREPLPAEPFFKRERGVGLDDTPDTPNWLAASERVFGRGFKMLGCGSAAPTTRDFYVTAQAESGVENDRARNCQHIHHQRKKARARLVPEIRRVGACTPNCVGRSVPCSEPGWPLLTGKATTGAGGPFCRLPLNGLLLA
jgi:hypothetical protein